MTPRIGPIFQIAYVVDDLDAAIAHWANTLGVGPFFVIRHAPYDLIEYKGQPAPTDLSIAFAQSGEINIELIEVHDDAPSVFRDFRLAHGAGQQHVGVLSDDIDADTATLEARGVPMVQRLVNAGGAETRFFATEQSGGTMLELVQRSPEADAAFAYMKQAAIAWDGQDPVAPIPQG